ncbi:MAG TPA: Hpt domain-containing protein, partial [Pseudoxanthomonas sp.]
PADEGALLDIAGALLYVDATLDDQVSRLGESGAAAEDSASSESLRTIEALAQEAIHNFASAREGFVAFIETNWDHNELSEVPRLLAEVSGALRMLELPQPADYLLGVRRYVAVELIEKRRVPGGQQLDTLADAMASLEYYLEALHERRPNREEILDITRTSLENLRYWPLPSEHRAPVETPVEATPIEAAPVEAAADVVSTDAPAEVIVDAVGSEEEMIEAVAFEEEVVDLADATVAQHLEAGALSHAEVAEAVAVHEPVAAPAAVHAVAQGGFEMAANDIDDDIREVFMEEFDEEIVNLGQLLAAWSKAPNDLERLRSIRRVFHTLKGSGRLVGAKLLGEFSWKIENMLNRVLDGSRPPSGAVVSVLEHSTQVLPQLNAALRGQGEVHADLAGLQDLSDRVASGEEVYYSATPSVVAEEDTDPSVEIGDAFTRYPPHDDVPAVFETETDGTPAMVDGVLREILETEVAAHLETVDAWLVRAKAAPKPADESLLRAFHTMNGAFAMADVPEITSVTGAAEQYIKRLWSSGEAPSAEGVDALADSAHAVRRSMAALQAPSPRIPVFASLAAQLTSLRDSLPEGRVAAMVVNDSAQHTYAEAMPAIEPPVSPGEIELAVHDLSRYVDAYPVAETEPVQPAAIPDEPALQEAEVAETVDELVSIDEEVVVETMAMEPAEPVTFFDMELTYARVSEPAAAEAPAVEAAEEQEVAEAEMASFVLVDEMDAELEVVGETFLGADATEEAATAKVAEPASAEDAAIGAAVTAQDEAVTADDAIEIAEPAAADAITDEVEAPAIEESVVEESVIEEPAVEELAMEEPAIEEQAVEEPAVEAQALEQEAPTEETEETRISSLESETMLVEEAIGSVDTLTDVAPEEPAVEAGVEEEIATEAVEAVDVSDEEEAEEEAADEAELAKPAVTATALPDDALDFTELDRDLVDIFVEEGNDLLDHSDGLLAKLRNAPEDRSLVTGLQRDLHTIKGGARMAGINAIGDLGHAIESLLEQVAAHRIELDRDGVSLLERGFDGLHGLVARVGAHRKAPMPDELIAEFERRARPDAVAAESAPQAGTAAAERAHAIALAPLSAPIDTAVFGEEEALPFAAQEQVRVRADLLDRLVNNAGEVAIYRSRLEQQLGAFRGAMAELDRTNTRLHDQLRRLDLETEAQIVARYQREQDKRDPTFDPLELDRFSTLQQLSRGLAESAADLTGLQSVLDDLARQYDGLLHQQSRVSSELQDGLMRARMVPFDGLVPRLRRVLRQAAIDTGKQVRLQLDGAHGELDRNVLERMTAPLEHMLRNAVAHGLESPKTRRKQKKPEEGTVQIALRREGAEMVLEVSDDGAGIDHAAIRRRAEQRGMIQSDTAMSDVDLERLILESGFSTSDSISQLAGRGVGMDVVYSEVRQLGGSLEIASESGKGTAFTLRLPQTLAVTQAVFVQVGETQFAVPVAAVGGVGRISRDRFETPGAIYVYGGEEYVLHNLGALVGLPSARAEGQSQVPLLLVHAGDLRAAVAVDQVLGNREIVVKPVGPQIASVPGIYGATITGDGRIVVILDAAPLVRRHILQPQLFESEAPAPEERRVPLVMVVDDSLTMRKVTGRVLERHNFEVSVARDGIEALERLEERVPDLMLLDIEMPRMDGYELATAMKADPRFKDVPIVMITSRTGEKHRQRAMEIGVQRYMGKPYQELDLMRNVYDLLGIARVRE